MLISKPGDIVGIDYAAIFNYQPLRQAAISWNELEPQIRQSVAEAQGAFRTEWYIAAGQTNGLAPSLIVQHSSSAHSTTIDAEQAAALVASDQWHAVPGYEAANSARDRQHLRDTVRQWLGSLHSSQPD